MCGRYVLDADLEVLKAEYAADLHGEGYWDYESNFNICPTVGVPVLAFNKEKQRKIVPMRWGLHPHWSRESPGDSKFGPLFNARMETVATKPSFRTPWKRRRALIPATHWYEWTKSQGGRIPWCINPESETLFAFAGLWDQWRVDEGITLLSCTILTCDSQGPTTQLHHRMPIRLKPEHWDRWLDPDSDPTAILEHRQDGEDLIFWEVDRAVNSNRVSGADLITPAV